ncbi:hypothetical protein Tco_0935335 [Tanacetum coccineum]
MAYQDVRLSKFEADFKHQQSDMTNKIDTVLKAITNRIAGALPSEMVKNLKLNSSLVLFARSYLTEDPQCSTHVHGSINVITIHPEQQSDCYDDKEKENKEEEKDNLENTHVNHFTPLDLLISFITEKVLKFNLFFESLRLVPQSFDTEVVCTKGEDGEVMFIELIRKNDDSSEGEPKKEGSTTTEGVGAEYFDIFPTRSELAYHKYLMCSPIPLIFLRNPIITEGSIIDPRLSQVVLGKPFVEISNMTHNPPEGVVRFTNETNEVAYKMPHMIEQYNSLSDLEKEHTKSVYLTREEEWNMLYLTRRSLEVLRKFHWIILEGRFNQLSHVSSPLLSKPGEY